MADFLPIQRKTQSIKPVTYIPPQCHRSPRTREVRVTIVKIDGSTAKRSTTGENGTVLEDDLKTHSLYQSDCATL